MLLFANEFIQPGVEPFCSLGTCGCQKLVLFPVREKSGQKMLPVMEPNSNKVGLFGVVYKITIAEPSVTYFIIMWIQLDLLSWPGKEGKSSKTRPR